MFSPVKKYLILLQKNKYFGQIAISSAIFPVGQLRDSVHRTMITEITGFRLSFEKGVDVFREELFRKALLRYQSKCVLFRNAKFLEVFRVFFSFTSFYV